MTMCDEDTIVAVSTPRGRAATGIVRLSGPRSFGIVAEMVGGGLERRTFTRAPGRLRLPSTAPFPVSVYVMLAPRSYTREDVVEIHAPGAPALLALIVEETVRRGARLAEPGEFTRRAFLSGRIDLAQAEAVMAVVRAASDTEQKLALSALAGDFSRRVKAVRKDLLILASDVEAGLDFVEDDVIFADENRQREVIASSSRAIAGIIEQSASRRVTSEEVTAVLFGPVNAGKSSLFNALAGSSEAIVEPTPGTTRDYLEAEVSLEGVRFLIVDTAGVRDPAEIVEKIAVERSQQAAERAQLVLFVVDASAPVDDDTERLYRKVRSAEHVVLLNKSDLPSPLSSAGWRARFGECSAVEVSAVTGKGIRELEIAMAQAVVGGQVDRSGGRFLIEERHRARLQDALACLERARTALDQESGDEIVVEEIRPAIDALGLVTGGGYTADLLEEVFGRFCIGK